VASTLPEAGPDAGIGDGRGARATGDGIDAWSWISGAGAALGLLVLAGLLAPGLVRRRRRSRWRRRSTPRAAVVGSWLTAVDELRVAGVDISPARAVSDVVGEARRRLGPVADPLVPLGSLVNRCRFAAGTPVTDEQVRRAWALCDGFVAARRQGRPVGQRLREHLGLRRSDGPGRSADGAPPDVAASVSRSDRVGIT
jgi:hypothetical protein